MNLSNELGQWRLKMVNGRRLPLSGPDGIFRIPHDGRTLHIVSSSGERTGWEHVSVSTWLKRRGREVHRCPTWQEMAYVKSLFWGDDEVVVEFHPAKENYINNHESVLHLWKWVEGEFPVPPTELVGLKGISQQQAKKLAEQGFFWEASKR